MVAPIPPDLLGITGPGPVPLNPGTPFPTPTAGPADMAGMVMGQLGAGGPGAPPMPGSPGLALGEPPPDDPIMAAMTAAPLPLPPFDPYAGLPDAMQPGYMPPLDHGTWQELANLDQERYTQLLQRFSRDLALYRQRISAKPPGFDPKREVAFKSATLSNIVNKLSNMCAPLDFRFNVPFKDETSKRNSQIMENWYSYLRECEKIDYASTGGTTSLQWDEFFYLFLYGRICKRILPNPTKEHDPFDRELIDPATVFPVWGGSTEGLVRITHRREMTALDVIATYLPQNESLWDRMQSSIVDEFGIGSSEVNRFYHIEREFIEGWDSWNQWASWGDVEVYNRPHKLGYVPWVYVMAKGEPRGMTTPQGRYWSSSWEDPDNPDEFTPVSEAEDLAQKGVSVFHHIVHTNRMSEMVYTLLFTQALSANNPATITYSAAQMGGNPPRPLNFKPGGNNQRTLNAQKVEIAPTSPRPSDTSPVLGKITGDIAEGSINPAMYGQIEGSNIAGFAIESMIAAAKDTVLPFMGAFSTYQALCASMMAKQYEKRISPLGIMSVPMEGKYGSSQHRILPRKSYAQRGRRLRLRLLASPTSNSRCLLMLPARQLNEAFGHDEKQWRSWAKKILRA